MVEGEAVKLALREVVGALPRALDRSEDVLPDETRVGVATMLAGCGGSSSATGTSTAAAPTTPQSGVPAGGPAPAELQGVWKLVSKNPDKGLLFVISEQHYSVPTRFAHGDLAVEGDEIAFFNAAICGLTLPDGVGRYRWKVEHKKLRFSLIGKEPCGGRSDILDDSTYTKVG